MSPTLRRPHLLTLTMIRPPQDAPYKTSKAEAHPDPEGNGEAALSYFKTHFGFNGRETVAILGAHTLGRVHNTISLFQYTWKTRSGRLFNNGYYRNIAMAQDWYYPTGDHINSTSIRATCVGFGDANGDRPTAKWVPTAFRHLTSGGPIQWLNYKKISPCFHPTWSTQAAAGCCNASNVMRAADATCEKEVFVVGMDEVRWPVSIDRPLSSSPALPYSNGHHNSRAHTIRDPRSQIMLNSDLGLYRNFSTEDGYIRGCPGLDNFNLGAMQSDWRFSSPKVSLPSGYQAISEPTPSRHQSFRHFGDNQRCR